MLPAWPWHRGSCVVLDCDCSSSRTDCWRTKKCWVVPMLQASDTTTDSLRSSDRRTSYVWPSTMLGWVTSTAGGQLPWLSGSCCPDSQAAAALTLRQQLPWLSGSCCPDSQAAAALTLRQLLPWLSGSCCPDSQAAASLTLRQLLPWLSGTCCPDSQAAAALTLRQLLPWLSSSCCPDSQAAAALTLRHLLPWLSGSCCPDSQAAAALTLRQLLPWLSGSCCPDSQAAAALTLRQLLSWLSGSCCPEFHLDMFWVLMKRVQCLKQTWARRTIAKKIYQAFQWCINHWPSSLTDEVIRQWMWLGYECLNFEKRIWSIHTGTWKHPSLQQIWVFCFYFSISPFKLHSQLMVIDKYILCKQLIETIQVIRNVSQWETTFLCRLFHIPSPF